tara:strand:- start:4766 stop:4960 length:195 start_codon:yes stop_codon:yes gene_type:complete
LQCWEWPKVFYADGVESNFRTQFDGAEHGGRALAPDFHEEPSGCRERRFEDHHDFPLSTDENPK